MQKNPAGENSRIRKAGVAGKEEVRYIKNLTANSLRPMKALIMKTLVSVAFVFISGLLMAGPKNRPNSDEIFQFNEETLDAIE